MFFVKFEEVFEYFGVFDVICDGLFCIDVNILFVFVDEVDDDGVIFDDVFEVVNCIEVKNIFSYKGVEKVLVYEVIC